MEIGQEREVEGDGGHRQETPAANPSRTLPAWARLPCEGPAG
jgi:hypothetical protein